jgi:hypothetical protein
MPASSRSGVLVIRVWPEDEDGAGLRARITMLSDPQSEDTTAAIAAGRDAIVAHVQSWLDEFAAEMGRPI